MIKDIVINLSVRGGHDPAVDYAVSIAEVFRAHITGIAFAYDPPTTYGPAVVPALTGRIPVEMIEAQRLADEKAAEAAIAKFAQVARLADQSAAWRKLTASYADAGDMFGRVARRFDISVVRQANPHAPGPEALIIQGALFDSGRPVVIVPDGQATGLNLDRVIVCWDGGRVAARAVADAMPFLRQAKAVDVITVTSEPAKSDEMLGADIGEHLARHGLKIEVRRIPAPKKDVPGTIQSFAAECHAGLIVIGGYGHWWFRECFFGGVTHGMLASSTVPVLMPH
jgi:nucleotide-binding universal stress UspA family protein